MGIFNFIKKQKLLALQNLVLVNAPRNKLVMTESQLICEANKTVQRELKIVTDCTKLVNTTTNPEVFFMRYDLLKEKAIYLSKFTAYIKFTGAKPQKMIVDLNANEQTAIADFLQRYYVSVVQKTRTLKTEKAKNNQYIKYYESLQKYYGRLNDENKKYIEERKPK